MALLAASETPNTAVSSERRRRAIDSELESENDDVIFEDGDTEIESNDEDPPTQHPSKRRQKMTVDSEVRIPAAVQPCDLFSLRLFLSW